MMSTTKLPLAGLAALAMLAAACSPSTTELDPRFYEWRRYESEPGATHFSALDQIDRTNVNRLTVAWTYETPGAASINPIVVDSMMYVFGDSNAVEALDAATGRRIWSHRSPNTVTLLGLPRGYFEHGITYWESEDRSDRRLLMYANTNTLTAIDALTGELIVSFGDSGMVDLRQGLDIDPLRVQRGSSPSPGAIFEDLIILGSSPGEGYAAGPGHIRAFNVRTGRQEWIFHTLPKPGEFGYETWPEGRSDEGGGANAWGGISVDVERGIAYVPLGSATYDFYGVDRHGQNLFANSLVALNARTGERLWHFQTVHHDLWDYDLTATPVLLTVQRDGRPLDIVVQATKTGMVFAFDRVTGEPLWPIEETPVPGSDMPGEQAWPTQPIPTKPEPFIPLTLSVEDFNPHMDARDRDSLEAFVRSMVYKGMYTPPDTRPTLQVPGNRGGANFASTSGDPRDGTFYVLSYNMPSVLMLEPITAGAVGTGESIFDQGQAIYQANCQICHRPNLQGQPLSGIPSLVGVTDRLSHDILKQQIKGGRGLMPGFPNLSDGEFDALQSFLANPDLALTAGEALTTGRPEGPVRYQSGWNHILDSKGVPVIKPPWFRMTAYDMNTGAIKWQAPIGEVPHLAEKGITNTGAANWLRGGPAITAGGLIFQMAGETFWAYDSATGEVLWRSELPGIGEGIPTVYEVNGRQYVVAIATAGGFGQPEPTRPRKPAYIVYSLPETD
ncbi:MAG: PQQ-binding-like beta-propeller repeat protein [Rhodothermales bacterium]